MGITADDLISQFSKIEEAPNRNLFIPGNINLEDNALDPPVNEERLKRKSLILQPHKLHFENKNLADYVTDLKYLADAGVPEAMILYAQFCHDGRYVSQNRPKAFKLIFSLLNKLPPEDQLAWVRKHLSDGFAAEVIQYRFDHQYGTAHAHNWWIWINQGRLNFTRMTIIAQKGALDLVRKHPAYASLAFGMFFVRIAYDAGVFFYSLNRDWEKIRVLNQFYDDKGFSVWLKRFMSKDGRPLRYANDIVWMSLGITGFVMDMVGLGGYAAAVPLVLGFLFDVGVEIYRAIKLYQAYSAELEFLGLKLQECALEKEKCREEIKLLLAEQKKLTRQLNDSKIPAVQAKIQSDIAVNEQKIETFRKTISKLDTREELFNSRRSVLEAEQILRAKRSAIVVASTALLFVGMFLGRIIPLAVSLDPMIGLGLVFAASAIILLHKLIVSINDYKDQKLKEKIHTAGEANNKLMQEVYGAELDDSPELKNSMLIDEETVLKKCEPRKKREPLVLPSNKFRLFGRYSKQEPPVEAQYAELREGTNAMRA